MFNKYLYIKRKVFTMALVSPGLQLTVTDESQYISNAVGTVPLVVLATAQDKVINGAIATGTTKTNAGALQIFGSQRDLSTAMGYPAFQKSSAGTPLHGNELNEYGLMTAYSALGVSNQLYAIRADIDLNELQPTSVRPTRPVSNGTVWFDTADTTWGINEWSSSSQTFTAKTPLVITSNAQVTTANTQGVFSGGSGYAYTPIQSVGTIGQYAVVTNDGLNRVYYKAGNDVSPTNVNNLYNQWVLLGTPQWHNSHATVTGTVSSSSLTLPTSGFVYMNINNSNVAIKCFAINSMANVAANINSAGVTGVTADVVNGYLKLYSNGASSGAAANDGKIIVSTDPTWNSTSNITLINALGLPVSATIGTVPGSGGGSGYYGSFTPPLMQSKAINNQPAGSSNSNGYGSYTDVPHWTNTVSGDVNAPNGSVWLKTGSTGGGSDFVFKRYNSVTGLWSTLSVNAYPTEFSALYNLDPIGGGINIPSGTIYMLEDPNTYSTSTLGYAGWNARTRNTAGAVNITGATTTPTFTSGTSFILSASVPGTATPNVVTITVNGTTGADFVTAVSAAAIPNVSASLASSGAITLTHSAGGIIVLQPTNASYPIPQQAGFTAAVPGVFLLGSPTTGQTVLSNFGASSYVLSSSTPVADPADGTLWYYSDPTVVDIMVNTGTAWKGYQNVTADARGYNLANTDPAGVIVAAATPATQSDGTALVAGDIWLDSSDLEHWPKLNRYNGSAWVAIDNTDHISVNGIVFADARWDNSGTNDAASGTEISTTALLTSNYLDLDAPNPLLYPRGMLLFNTRRSGYNVKKYVQNYFNTTADNVSAYSSGTAYTAGQIVSYGANVLYVCILGTTAGTAPTNTTYWAPLQTGTWVTTSGLNTMTNVPYSGHYAQRQVVVAAMKSALDSNTEIREEQFKFSLIVAPGYPELIPNMVSLNNDRANTAFVIGDTPMDLSTNIVDITNWSNDTNGDGLATNDPYLGVYYPGGLSTDLGGNTIMVPASHMALRTYLYSDNVSYPWFAPAGTRRGLVSNATDLGYVDYASGEFVRTGVNQAMRDALYQLKINPITIIPGIGLVVWGNLTRDPNTESMNRINVARLVNYVRTIFANAGNAFLFEPNDKITRDQFAGILNRALNDLVAKRGIYDYLVVCDTTNNTPDRIANNQMYADVAIEPMKDVEFIYIPIRLFNPGDIAGLGGK